MSNQALKTVRKTHLAHLAYLRACADGIEALEAAKRYLGLQDGRRVAAMHAEVVGSLRALARRCGEKDWRLLGATVRDPSSLGAALTLDEFIMARGLDGWSEAEVLDMYQAEYPTGTETERRRQGRNARIRARIIALLRRLEPQAAEPVKPEHPVDAWLPDDAERLAAGGLRSMGELARAIAAGGRWWSRCPAIGPKKAARIADQVKFIDPNALAPAEAGGLVVRRMPMLPAASHELDGSCGANRHAAAPLIGAQNDAQAIDSWLGARAANSPQTEKSYRREAERFLLWCVLERRCALSSVHVDDCVGYLDFLKNIPSQWISRTSAGRHEAGWTPFKDQLSPTSRTFAVNIVSNLMQWLVAQRYLDSNPWTAINRKQPSGLQRAHAPTSRALTPEAYGALLDFADNAPYGHATERNRFLLRFLRYTGLRATELIDSRLEALHFSGISWVITVVGKGQKERPVSVPSPAVLALDEYLNARGIAWPVPDQQRHLPLVASLEDPAKPVSYLAIYLGFKSFVRRGLEAWDATEPEKRQALKATLHWLRHTYATRAAEAGLPEDVLMAELGHASRDTTARYYTAQADRQHREVERVSTLLV
jgi:integrase